MPFAKILIPLRLSDPCRTLDLMDAGLAAVIAGASGAGGAALAAFATSFGLLKQAKIQGAQTHQLWLRNHQQQVCEAFLADSDGLQHACRDAVTVLRREYPGGQEELVATALEVVKVRTRALKACSDRLALLTDERTDQLAIGLNDTVITLAEETMAVCRAVLQGTPGSGLDRLDQPSAAVATARVAFVRGARTLLHTI